MVNTEIGLIIFFAAKDGEALYSQQNQVGKNRKDEKRDKGGGEGAPSWEGNPVLERES